MQAATIEQLYEQHVEKLPVTDQLALITMISQRLTNQPKLTTRYKLRVRVNYYSIMELHGLGKEIWQDIDAQDYVNTLRQEWNERL